MELVLKNVAVAQMLEKAGDKMTRQTSMDEAAQIMIGAYVQDVLEYSAEAGQLLDLTYGTVDKLAFSLAALYRTELGEGDAAEQRAAVTTAKHLAAYLFALAMNEHGCTLKATRAYLPVMKTTPADEPAWVNNTVRIRTGIVRQLDFLPAVLEATGLEYFPGERPHLHIEAAPIRRIYRDAVGVELQDHGYAEMIFQG